MATLDAIVLIMNGPSSSHTAGPAKAGCLLQHGLLRLVLEAAGL
ncbi:MAG: hypothetical protein NTX94_03770 [Caldiserica bacterium]|nr:hypothetical protein [Caldisericota bacterium]